LSSPPAGDRRRQKLNQDTRPVTADAFRRWANNIRSGVIPTRFTFDWIKTGELGSPSPFC
jgi:hypothetical protein